MPLGSKKKKGIKRRRPTSVLLDDAVVNLGGGSSVDDCLGEFEQAAATASRSQNDTGEESLSKETKRDPLDSTNRINSNDDDDDFLSSTQLLPLIGKPCPALHRRQKDRLSNWKANFGSWQTNGRYISGLLPSFELELTRHFKVQELSTFLLKACPQLRMPAFERWLIDAKVEEGVKKKASSLHHEDPILALHAQDCPASQRLIQEIVESDSTVDAEHIVQQLCQKTTLAAEELSIKARQFAEQCPLHKGDRIVVEQPRNPSKIKNKSHTKKHRQVDDHDSNSTLMSLVFHRKRWKQPFRIKVNAAHYQRLQSAFSQTHGLDPAMNKGKRATIHAFHLIVMTLALRYSSLSGGQLLNDLRGGGMQGAIHGQVFQVLQQELLANRNGHYLVEGFASPWNNACTNYASAFSSDLDFHFGSFGNFLEMRPSRSVNYVCEVNPPFAPALMNCMVDHIEQLVKSANQYETSATFVVVVPTSTSSSDVAPAKAFAHDSFQRIIDSSHCVRHTVLSARDHGYVEGAQHLRPTRYKESQYDTSVILIMSSRAQSDYAISSEKSVLGRLEKRLRKSFASRHLQELALRKAAAGEVHSD